MGMASAEEQDLEPRSARQSHQGVLISFALSSNLFHIAVPERPLPPLAASRLAVTAVSPRLPLQRFPSQRKKERQKKKKERKKKRKMSSKDLRKQLFWFLFWSGYS